MAGIKSVRASLVYALENLRSRDLKAFRFALCDRKEPRFSRRAVDDADEMDLVDLLINVCTEAKAVQFTIDIFNELGLLEHANKLGEAMASGSASLGSTSAAVPADETSKRIVGGEHFIDKFRHSLIQRVSMVEPVLDRLLYYKVISDELYATICKESTSQSKMRMLLGLGNICRSNKGKGILYDTLMDLEPFLMEDLMGAL